MRFLFSIILIIAFTVNSSHAYTDTIDVWTIKLNGKPIINSNQSAIMDGQPMMINLFSFADTDTLDICFWTDTGSQMQKWDYIFKDANYVVLERFTNPIDTALTDENNEYHKGYISYRVDYLKNLCKKKNIKTIIVQFEFANVNSKGAYAGLNICIISTL